MVTKRNFIYDLNPGEETLINYSTSLCKMRNLSKFWAWMIYWPDRKSYHHLKVNICVLSACDNAKLNYKSPYIPVQKITKKCNTNKIVNLFLRETGSPWEMLPFQGVTYISQTTILNYQTRPTLSGSLFINHCDHVAITCSMMKRTTHGNAWGNGGWIKQGLQWFIQQISDEKDKTFTPFTWSNSTCQTAFRFTVKIKLWLIVLECFYDNCKSKYLLLVYINKCHKL